MVVKGSLVAILLPPVPSHQHHIVTFPLRPCSAAIRTHSLKAASSFSNLPLGLLAKRATSRLGNPRVGSSDRIVKAWAVERESARKENHNRQTLHPQGSINGCTRLDGKTPSYRFARLYPMTVVSGLYRLTASSQAEASRSASGKPLFWWSSHLN
jgi:hypothetical protein